MCIRNNVQPGILVLENLLANFLISNIYFVTLKKKKKIKEKLKGTSSHITLKYVEKRICIQSVNSLQMSTDRLFLFSNL